MRKRPLFAAFSRFPRKPSPHFRLPLSTFPLCRRLSFFACYLPSFLAETAHRFSVKLFYHIRRLLSIASACLCLPLGTLYTACKPPFLTHSTVYITPFISHIPFAKSPVICQSVQQVFTIPASVISVRKTPSYPAHFAITPAHRSCPIAKRSVHRS